MTDQPEGKLDHQDGKLPGEAAPAEGDAAPATVQAIGDWRLVSYGSWQISVGPDGLIMLPRHLHPREWQDFAGCMAVAVDVAGEIHENLRKAAEATPRGRTPSATVVSQGDPPPGTARIRAVSAQQRAATIGRPNKRRVDTAVGAAADVRPAATAPARSTRRKTS